MAPGGQSVGDMAPGDDMGDTAPKEAHGTWEGHMGSYGTWGRGT